jgi:predicted tellurium resistance membrane protein TerC
MIGEIGGPDEAEAARWCKANMKKPIVGFIAGVTAPPGKRMGHAGALISGGADTADAKLAIMEECGFTVTRNPSEMAKSMFAAIRTILIADLVMSLDNVIAVAAAAKGSTTLLIIGLAISIPLVIFGSTLMIKLMERFPIIVMLGAALIGWVGGETIVSDVALKSVLEANPWLHYGAAAAGAALVIGTGKLLQAKSRARHAE